MRTGRRYLLAAAVVVASALLAARAALPPRADALRATYHARNPKPQAPPKEAPRGVQPAAAFDASKAYEHLRQMVAIGPRPSGSAAIHQTRAYITRQLSSYGLTVQEQKFTADTPFGKVDMINLIVRLPGRRQDRILLTGHYDTKLYRNQVFVGASDGASSAAILVELGRVLKARPHEFTYELVFFDGEEAVCENWDQCGTPGSPDHTYGSRYYVQAAKQVNALGSIKALVLFDMIGARNLKLRRDTEFAAAWLNDIIWNTGKRLGHADVFIDANGDVGGDDHQPFAEAGIPTTDIIDLHDYPQWHTPQDDLAHVAAGSLQIVGDVMLAALPEIERRLAR